MEAQLRFSAQYRAQLAELKSPKAKARIGRAIKNLKSFPNMGSQNIRQSLAKRYGASTRRLVAGEYLILYRYADGVVTVLGIAHARLVR